MLATLLLTSLAFLVLAIFLGSQIPKMAPQALQAVYNYTVETLQYLNDGEMCYGKKYSTLRHTRPFIYYAGTRTVVPISVFGKEPLPDDRKVFLQRRGYRTGLLGWTLGSLLGGAHLPGWDVTPQTHDVWSATTRLTTKQRAQYDADISHLFSSASAPGQTLQQTLLVHIPVASGDGYFRLRVTSRKGEDLAVSGVFRVGSLTWASAQPRGASIVGIVPELGVRAAFLTAKTAAWTAFYASFPFLTLATYLPGQPGTRWLSYAYRLAGGDTRKQELDERYGLSKGWGQAKESVQSGVPFGAVGVRTGVDLKRDAEAGRGGIWFERA
ncbi:hypothetical protein CALCODRAFT_479010 [Calocera cornea HHB12733]|uniref:Uncharacterized protein n=1 Tax=Calocera cornea HHB12733 TaxID=1353952 RepID=A0A165K5T9_9BASI|nr:hypothetical protein CALCODRAFT_479010 [Calocera cornea HHB12733]